MSHERGIELEHLVGLPTPPTTNPGGEILVADSIGMTAPESEQEE
jgi:hypothetical protein